MDNRTGASPVSAKGCPIEHSRPRDDGMTLIELMAGITIAGIVMTVIASISLYVTTQVTSLLSHSQAQREVMAVSSGLASVLSESDWVELNLQPAGSTFSTADAVRLVLYKNGTYEKADGSPGDYSAGIYTNGTLQHANQTGEIDIVRGVDDSGQQTGLWDFSYANKQGRVENIGAAGLEIKYPQTAVSGNLINSIVLDLSATYSEGSNHNSRYTLTMGYHDRDLR